jgi:hypothetical protein
MTEIILAASSWRTRPSRPLASARSRGSACGPRGGRRSASTSTAYNQANLSTGGKNFARNQSKNSAASNARPCQGAPLSPNVAAMRAKRAQSLTLILAAASLHRPAKGVVTVKPEGERVNEGLDAHILQVNLKQSGRNSVHLPISYRFDPPIVVPDGKLSALIITETYAAKITSWLLEAYARLPTVSTPTSRLAS